MKRQERKIQRQKGSKSDALPVEGWQVVAVERLPGDRECDAWGRDGRRVLEWFDLGDLRDALAEEAWPGIGGRERAGSWARFRAWLRSLLFPPETVWEV